MIRSVRRSARSRRSGSGSRASRQTAARLDATSMAESKPKPTKAMLPARKPAPRATAHSAEFHAMVRYWSRRPARAARTRCSAALRGLAPTVSMTSPIMPDGYNPGVDLFDTPAPSKNPPPAPLADRIRPKTLDEIVGQEHLIGSGKVLRRALEDGALHSMILWGPPGTGKTTLARLMADIAGARFVSFSAVLAGVKEIRQVVAEAEADREIG